MKINKDYYIFYIKSKKWYETKKRFLNSKLIERDNIGMPICSFCKRNDITLHVHHITYKTFGNENLHHLKLLCENCHNLIHSLVKDKNINVYKATKLAAKIIGKQVRKNKHQYTDNKILDNRALKAKINFGAKTELRKLV